MAIVYSDNYKKSYKTELKTSLVGVFETPDARTLTAEMKVMTLDAAGAAGNNLVSGRLPKNATVRQIAVHGNTGGNVTVNLRDIATLDVTPLPAELKSSGALADGVSKNLDYLCLEDVAVEATLAAAETGFKVVIYYTEM